jgi:predicted DNA-binding ribbon-helix-helix protein
MRTEETRIRKRSVNIAGHPTSVSLEQAFWDGLAEIAAERDISISRLIAEIDEARTHGGLSSAIRLHVLAHYRRRRSSHG